MKWKWLLTLICMVVLIAGCGEGNLAGTVMTAQNTDLAIRAGYIVDNTEVGGVVKYVNSSEIEWGPEPDLYGGYIIFHLTQDVSIKDTPEYSPLRPWLEALHAKPYAGLELVNNSWGDGLQIRPNWIAGTSFVLSEESNLALNVEYIDGDASSGDVFIGIQGRF